jgi:hypothetical protein
VICSRVGWGFEVEAFSKKVVAVKRDRRLMLFVRLD